MKKLKWIGPDEVVVEKKVLETKDEQIAALSFYAAVYKKEDRRRIYVLIAFLLLVLGAVALEFIASQKSKS